jgi:putative membrane protein
MSLPGLSASDLEAVRRAVAAAEAESAGEIVPYVVAASDPYPGTAWKGAALGALLAALLAWVVHGWGGFWGGPDFFWMVVPPAAGAALGLLAVHFLPPLHRWLAGTELIELRTHRRAAAAFLEREVFRTPRRTGILLFVSLLERRVVVLADSGIHERVEDGAWDAVVARIVAGIRRGDPGAALAVAIRECGDLLVRHGLRHAAGSGGEPPATRPEARDSATEPMAGEARGPALGGTADQAPGPATDPHGGER